MISVKKSVMSLVAALTCVAAGERSSLANEPVNNAFPGGSSTYYGSPYEFECGSGSCGFGGGSFGGSLLEIGPSGDVDYFVATCGTGTVTSISINIASSAGDLDLQVLKPSQSPIGSSTGTTKYESVSTTSANMNSVVAKIYGYAGATGGYQLNVYCSG